MPRFLKRFRTSALALATMAAGLVSFAGSTKLIMTPQGGLFFSDEQNIFAVNVATNRLELVLPNQAANKLLVDAEGRLCGRQLRYDAARDVWCPAVWRYHGRNQTPEFVPEKHEAKFDFAETVDAAGNLYFWESDRTEGFSRLLVRHRDGPVTLLAGHRWGAHDGHGADAQLGNLGGIAVGPDGSVYFCDGPALRKVSAAGEVTTLATGGLLNGRDASVHNSITPNPLSFIAVDSLNFIYVADLSTARLLRVSPAGETVLLSSDDMHDWIPEGLASKGGTVYVAESHAGSARVRRLEMRGMAGGVAFNPVLDPTGNPYRNPVWLSQRAEGAAPADSSRPISKPYLLQIPKKSH